MLGPPICKKCYIYLIYEGHIKKNNLNYQGKWFCPNGCSKEHYTHLFCLSKEEALKVEKYESKMP